LKILFLDDDETRHRAISPQLIGHDKLEGANMVSLLAKANVYATYAPFGKWAIQPLEAVHPAGVSAPRGRARITDKAAK
jgi:hypothetical protein